VEATSIAAIEAMALGKPVVASDIGGLKELISNDENGMLINPGEPKGIAQSIVSLIRHPDFRISLGEQAKRTVEARFSVNNWFDRHLSLYEQLNESR